MFDVGTFNGFFSEKLKQRTKCNVERDFYIYMSKLRPANSVTIDHVYVLMAIMANLCTFAKNKYPVVVQSQESHLCY